MFKTISENTVAEIVEKKSKFIANIFYIESIEEAEKIIKENKKKYFDARHNCYAFRVFTKEGIVDRFSDDGEPSGTAGSPMLNVLVSQNLNNILVIVTRYFGGILLGTGGLVRAYTGATIKALESVSEINKDLGLEVRLDISYSDFEKVKYYFNQNDIKIVDLNYSENVSIIVEITDEKLGELVENKENINFNIIKQEIIREKYIQI